VTTITLSKSDAAGVKSDAVVIGVVKLGGGVTLPAGTESLNAAYGGKLVEVLSGLGASGKTGEVTKVPGPLLGKPGKSPTLIAVGLGTAPDGVLKTEDLRAAAGCSSPGRRRGCRRTRPWRAPSRRAPRP
jgi:leucyl aminopeptidase